MSRVGYKFGPMSEEHKQKISEANKGRKKPLLIGNQNAKGHKPNNMSFKKGIIPWNKGKKYPQITGKKHFRWNGGITKELNKIRNSPEQREWRRKIFERDNYTCRKCIKRGSNLIAHHLQSFTNNLKLRTLIVNGKTLCEDCHDEFHKIYGKGKNTVKQYLQFITGTN